ncbi:ABC transporter ATP-binding protein [Aquipuribacter sp. MA13-6]|uniref:ABC transporter ATP-binding protein n=1 Tax=unclassified Aquipuribacter TaxID=2635084 RepID=UPI003EEC8A5B
MVDLAVRTRGLRKTYGRQVAVDDVDLAVPTGAVYGFLGPNGSGKTSTIRVLLGLAAPTSGDVELLGRPMPSGWRHVLPRVGALVEGPAFYPWLSGPANLARLDAADRDADARTRRDRIGEAVERVGLTNAGAKRVKAYSLGMKQRLGIAAALLRPRDLLVLDEPTNGLDPQGTREVRSLVRSLAADGTTLVVSSHLLAEIEQVCSHVGVMSGGRLVAQGTLAELGAGGDATLVLRTPDHAEAARTLAGTGLSPVAAADGTVRALLPPPGQGPGPAVEDLVAALVAAGVRVQGVDVRRDSLEDRFVALTGEGFEVVA